MIDQTKPSTFTVHSDADNPTRTWVTVDHWQHRTLMSPHLTFTEANGASIRLDGSIHIVVANGMADYRVVGWDAQAQAFVLELIASVGPTDG